MKNLFIITALLCSISLPAQPRQTVHTPKPKISSLPLSVYNVLRDSCNGLDITFLTGVGGSMSLANKNVKFFTSFVTTSSAAKKPELPQEGLIMWEIDGREYLTGNLYFSGDSSGYLVFNKNNHEYINALSPQGAGFLMTHGKKK